MKTRVLGHIDSQPWAITEDALAEIRGIATRASEERELTTEAVERALGRPLENTREVRVRHGIAVVPVHGPLFRYANLFTRVSGAVSTEELANDIGAALRNPRVERIIIDIDSPGGEVRGTEELGEILFQARNEKPITALVSGFAASGAYWLASSATEVVTVHTGALGGIGTVFRIDRQEDDRVVVVSSQSPRKNVDPRTDQGRADIQALLDSLAQVFIEKVARNRSVTADVVMERFGQGGLLVGQDAVAAGLADRMGTLESLIEEFTGRGVSSAALNPAAGGKEEEPNMATKTEKQSAAEGAEDRPEINRAYLEAHHPDLVEEIRAEGHAAGVAEGREAGVSTERERVAAIQSKAVSGQEEVVAQLVKDGTARGEAIEALFDDLKERKVNRASAMQGDEEDVKDLGHASSATGAGGEESEDRTVEMILQARAAANGNAGTIKEA